VAEHGANSAIQELDKQGKLCSEISYYELDAMSDGVALRLQQAGVGTGDRVALLADASTDCICTILALVKLGAAYVPIDNNYPQERIDFMLSDCEARLLIDFQKRSVAITSSVEILQIELSACKIPANAALNFPATMPNSPLYVMYTSGSTGQAKGVEVVQKGVIRLVSAQNSYCCFDASSRFLQLAPLTFDASTLEIWGPLLNGGCCVLSSFSNLPDPKILIRILQNQNINSLWLTAAFFNWLVDNEDLSTTQLKYLLVGGEALSVNHIKKAQLMLPNTIIVNGYGPTETTTFACCYPIPNPIPAHWISIPIGYPINETEIFILDKNLKPVGDGEQGQLYIGGAGLAKGYINLAEQTRQRFIEIKINKQKKRVYATGDVVKKTMEGAIEYLGREDDQVKIAGHRIELGEVNHAILKNKQVKQAYTSVVQQGQNAKKLIAYIVSENSKLNAGDLRNYLRKSLPDFMLPAEFIFLEALPLNQNGKVDRKALPQPSFQSESLHQLQKNESREIDNILQKIWAEVLNQQQIKRDDNFFDIGGSSLIYMEMISKAKQTYNIEIGAVDIFEAPRFDKFCTLIKSKNSTTTATDEFIQTQNGKQNINHAPIAIIGMSGRFPGAESAAQFWDNLKNEIDSITDFDISDLDLTEQKIAVENNNYIYARGIVNDVDCFDAEFFDVSAREAAATDPQQRLFLEEAWKALESAGYYPQENNQIGVFAGSGHNRYYLTNVFPNYGVEGPIGDLPTQFVNDKDYLATRTAFKLNLQGPALSINTACSTSLVAVVEAVKSLRTHGCNMALAGGVSLQHPMNSGYLYQEGGMLSADGRTRSFSSDSSGTAFNSGVAIVVLKRLQDAQRDGDHISAVIHGVASNNDGSDKASFTAPSVKGQVAVIDAAFKDASFSAHSIDFVETHGTATPLGDPIEVEALQRAFDKNNNVNRHQPCLIGTAKSNVGHLVSAAGVTGLIKAAYALNNRLLPASLHFDAPSPNINFESRAFKVCHKNNIFSEPNKLLRAGVSSFGVGGTNAHIILQEHKIADVALADEDEVSQPRLFVVSAKSADALAQYADKMAAAVSGMNQSQLKNTAFTLQVSRSFLPYRTFCIADTAEDAYKKLQKNSKKIKTKSSSMPAQKNPLVFLFSGQGSQCMGMGKQLYQQHAIYRDIFDQCADLFAPLIGHDIRQILFATAAPTESQIEKNAELLRQTQITQPALFAQEYALAKLWMSLGVVPDSLIGHSIGEYVAAALSGIFTLLDAIKLVARRGQLMQSMQAGSMLSVKISQPELQKILPAELQIAAINAPGYYVVSGESPSIAEFETLLQKQKIKCTTLATSHAFHSQMMRQAAQDFAAAFDNISMRAPSIAVVSTSTGKLLSDQQAQSSEYWCQQLLNPVLFATAIETVCHYKANSGSTFLEVGPGVALTILSKASFSHSDSLCINSGINGDEQEMQSWLNSLGQLWQLGHQIKWSALYSQENTPRRIPLPTYPFKKQRHWMSVADNSAQLMHTALNPVTNAANILPTTQSLNNLITPKSVENNMSMKQLMVSALKSVFTELTGNDISDADDNASFLELGLDSLLLTQIVLKLKNNYKLDIPFRRLMQDLDNFSHLAEFIIDEAEEEFLPMASTAVSSSAQTAMPIENSIAAINMQGTAELGVGNMHQLLSQQLQLISRQLQLLGGAPVASAKQIISNDMKRTKVSAPPTIEKDQTSTAPKKVKTFGAQTKIELAHNKDKQSKDSLSAKQQDFHDQIIESYLHKTAASKSFTKKHRPILADPRSVSGFTPENKEVVYPIVVKKSSGCRFWDLDDNEYIDTLCGYGSNFFGYSPPFIIDAMKDQLDKGIEIGPQHPLAGEVAQLLAALIPLERFAFCNTGSEAVMGAIRMARTATGRNKIVMFKGSYHGINDEVIVRPFGEAGSMPAAAGICNEAVSNTIVLNYDDPKSLQIIEQRKDEIAAVLVEPVQSRNPKLQPQSFLIELRELTTKHNIALIFDEVITGFRLGAGGAQKYFGVQADIATYGKVIGGGISIGIIGGARQYLDTLDGGQWEYGDDSAPEVGVTYFAGTFVRHPLALAAAKAVLMNVKEKGDQQARDVAQKTEDFAQDLNIFFKYEGVPLEIEYFSSMMYLNFTRDEPYGDLLFCDMRTNGIHIWYGRPMFFTLAHTQNDIDKIKTTFMNSVLKMKEMNLLSSE